MKILVFEFDDLSEEKVNGDCCRLCGDTPCRWVHYKSEVIRRVEAVYGDHICTLAVANLAHLVLGELDRRIVVMRECRKYAFKTMCFIVHRSLGRGVRIRHTPCVEEGVHEAFLPPDGEYVGFMEE